MWLFKKFTLRTEYNKYCSYSNIHEYTKSTFIYFFNKQLFDLNFDVIHADTDNRYVDGNDTRLVNLGPITIVTKSWQHSVQKI